MSAERTPSEFQDAVQRHGITEWHLRDCGFCHYPLKYLFVGEGEVYFDSGCYCTGGSGPQLRSWHDIADHYNMQSSERYIATLDAFFKFEPREAGA